jgi:hypothetical protein
VEKRNQSVWEMMSDKFNDQTFSPQTESVINLHSDYKESEAIPHSKVSHMLPATPEKCHKK